MILLILLGGGLVLTSAATIYLFFAVRRWSAKFYSAAALAGLLTEQETSDVLGIYYKALQASKTEAESDAVVNSMKRVVRNYNEVAQPTKENRFTLELDDGPYTGIEDKAEVKQRKIGFTRAANDAYNDEPLEMEIAGVGQYVPNEMWGLGHAFRI